MAVTDKTEKATATFPDYSALIERLEADLAEAKIDLRAARDEGLRYRAQLRVREISRAIENAKAAEGIEAERVGDTWIAKAVQFAFPSREGVVPMPPAVDEYATVFPPIRYSLNRYVATDPLEIACLRRGGFEEVPVGYVYGLPPDHSPDGVWLPFEIYQQQREKGMVR